MHLAKLQNTNRFQYIYRFGYNVFSFIETLEIVTNITFNQLVLLDTLQLVAGATGFLSQGVTAVVHVCSVCALGRISGEITLLLAGGVTLSVHQYLPWQCNGWVPSGVLLWEEHKLSAFCAIFIEVLVLEDGVVSQPYNYKQHTSLNTGRLTHRTGSSQHL